LSCEAPTKHDSIDAGIRPELFWVKVIDPQSPAARVDAVVGPPDPGDPPEGLQPVSSRAAQTALTNGVFIVPPS